MRVFKLFKTLNHEMFKIVRWSGFEPESLGLCGPRSKPLHHEAIGSIL